jgi:hypothetical protein
MAIAITNPVTGEVLKEFDELRSEELEDKLSRAAAAAASYRLTSVEVQSHSVSPRPLARSRCPLRDASSSRRATGWSWRRPRPIRSRR